jgi:spore maturation protein SpmA
VNAVFLVLVVAAVLTAAVSGTMADVSKAALGAASASVEIAIGLIGAMALFLGLTKVAEDAGLLRLLARVIRPVMVRLFPDVPADHPAMGAMILNFAANMLGLGNAATPLGIKAMQELETLNRTPGVATNAMCMFLAINTSGLRLLPTDVVAVRAEAGSADPWGIVAPTLVATTASTTVAIVAAWALSRLRAFAAPPPVRDAGPASPPRPEESARPSERLATWGVGAFLLGTFLLLVVPALGAAVLPGDDPRAASLRDLAGVVSAWVVPVLLAAVLAFAARRRVKVYESFVEGARGGFETGVKIIPYLVAILVSVGMLRASGALGATTSALGAATAPLGLPGEVLPLAFVRPLSGSGAFGLMTDLVHAHGPDSYVGYTASVVNGATETTFYVLAVYFGAVAVTRARHALAAGLLADLGGVLAAGFIAKALFAPPG